MPILPCGPLGLLGCANRRTCRVEHGATTVGQRDEAAIAGVQRSPHLLLQAMNLLRESRLSEIQSLCGTAEVQLLRQDNERPK
jgi:hypothetical protein